MNQFFTSLKKTGIRQLGLSISYDNDKVSVSILPKSGAKDKGLDNLKPLNLCASVEEMDNRFFEVIAAPLAQTKGVFDNVESYEASLKASAEKTEVAKKKKESISKRFKALQNLMNGKDFNALKDHEKAMGMAKEILAQSPEHKEAKKIVQQMEQYESPNLFQDAS